MTKREFVSIALKLLAVYSVIVSASSLTYSITQFVVLSQSGTLSSSAIIPRQIPYIMFFPVVAQIGIPIFLWLFADALSTSIVREDAPFAGRISLNEAKSVAFSVVGVWLAANALVDFVRHYV